MFLPDTQIFHTYTPGSKCETWKTNSFKWWKAWERFTLLINYHVTFLQWKWKCESYQSEQIKTIVNHLLRFLRFYRESRSEIHVKLWFELSCCLKYFFCAQRIGYKRLLPAWKDLQSKGVPAKNDEHWGFFPEVILSASDKYETWVLQCSVQFCFSQTKPYSGKLSMEKSCSMCVITHNVSQKVRPGRLTSDCKGISFQSNTFPWSGVVTEQYPTKGFTFFAVLQGYRDGACRRGREFFKLYHQYY